jgi:hypothetical protein
MTKKLFYSLLSLIQPILETKNPMMALRSSGDAEVLEAATQRHLARGSYLDLVD